MDLTLEINTIGDKLGEVAQNTMGKSLDFMSELGSDLGSALESKLEISSETLSVVSQVTEAMQNPTAVSEAAMDMAQLLISSQVNGLIGQAGDALSGVQVAVDATNEVVQIGKKVLDGIVMLGTIESNIERALNISTTTDPDVKAMPGVKESIKRLSASVKQQIIAAYMDAKQQFIDLGNSMIVTNNDAAIDNVSQSIDKILETVDPLVGEIVYKYSGISIPEVRATANEGFQKINQFKRVIKSSKTAIEDRRKKAEQNEKDKESAENAAKLKAKLRAQAKKEKLKAKKEELERKMKAAAAAQADSLKSQAEDIEKQLESYGKDIADNVSREALEQVEKWKSDYSPEQIKEQLLEWVNKQTVIIQNVFCILAIKDLVDDIRRQIQSLQSTSIDNLEDFVDMMGGILDLMSTMGITQDAEGITIDDITAVVDEVKQLDDKAVEMFTTIIQSAKSSVTLVTALKDAVSMDDLSSISAQAQQAALNVSILALNINAENAENAVSQSAQSVVNSVGDIASQTADITKNAASKATETAKMIANLPNLLSSTVLEAISEKLKLTSVQNLLSKTLIFDPILKIIQTVLPLLDVFTVLVRLVNNYKTNKEHVQAISVNNITEKAKALYKDALGLLGTLSLNLKNFYTVRTLALYGWIIANIELSALNYTTLEIDAAQTIKLKKHLKEEGIDDRDTIVAVLPTALYIDYKSIEDGSFADGTLTGLDSIIIDSSIVYYDLDGRSTITSEILRYANLPETPLSSDGYSESVADVVSAADLTADEKFEMMLQGITVKSDEIDGKQAVSLDDMYLCPPSEKIEAVDEPDEAAIAIIEFGDEYTKGTAVDYVVNVKPGQQIGPDTIIGYIQSQGKLMPIRSIFNKGTVKATADGQDYWHVFGNCKRHIAIENWEPSTGTDYDPEKINALSAKMAEHGRLVSLIMNSMPYSALPLILVNRKPGLISTSLTKFKRYIETYEDLIESYRERFLKEAGEDGIRGTGGNPGKMKEQQLKVLDLKESMLSEIIDLHMEKLPNISCIGQINYSDCAHLAYGSSLSVPSDMFKIGSETYANYYFALLSNVDIANDSEWNHKYYDLLSEIITTRVQTESYSLNNVIREFDSLYRQAVSYAKDPYKLISSQFSGSDIDYEKLTEYIKHSIIYANAGAEARSEFEALKNDKTSQDSWYNLQYNEIILSRDDLDISALSRQLANIFLYIKTSEPQMVTETSSEISIETLKVSYENSFRDLFDADEKHPYERTAEVYRSYLKAKGIDIRMSMIDWFRSLNASYDDETYVMMVNMFGYIFTDNKQIDEATANFVNNRLAYELVRNEAEKLRQFWDDCIIALKTDYSIDALINEFILYGESLNAYAVWNAPTTLYIGNKNYTHYLFYNKDEEPLESIADLSIEVPDEIPSEVPKPVIDASAFGMEPQPLKRRKITMFDYEYWLVYFVNATLVTLIPAYWSDGFDVPPVMTPTPLPQICLPIMKPIYIQPLKLLLVFAIGVRGLWPAPIVISVNMSSHDINAMLPVQIATEIVKLVYGIGISALENTIPGIIKLMENALIEENAVLAKAVQQYKTYAALIKSIPLVDKALIEKEFREALHGAIDRREVITRTTELDNGPQPM